jgi:hypothetical protein
VVRAISAADLRHAIEAAMACGVAVAACGGQSASAARINVRGVIDYQGGGGWSQSSGPCEYGPSPGQVVLTDGSHDVLASAQLWKGRLRDSADCILPFTFSGVPDDRNQYGVTVSGHGTVWFSQAQIAKPLQLSLSG